MLRLLNQPYPCELPVRQRWFRAALIGTFVGLFLLVFQPFGLSIWETSYKIAKIAGFGLVTLLITGLYPMLIILVLGRQFRDERWTVGREIVLLTTNLLLIGLANYLYLSWLIKNPINGQGLLSMILVTFVVGIFPISAVVVLNYIIQLKKYSRSASSMPIHESHSSDHPPQTSLTLTAENERDQITLAPSELLYIESSDNYSTIVYLTDGRPTRLLLRSSLSRLENQLAATAFQNSVVRCHRSFIVNLEKVEKVSGNAQGYKLHLQDGACEVPVARKYNESLIRRLKALS